MGAEAGRREGWVERGGVRLHYVEWAPDGAEPPALLLLHGLSSNALIWERVAAALPHRRIVALDQRSHGLSDRPETGYGQADLVADAAHAVAELGLGRPVVAGHSWGASVALSLAAAHPESAAGLMLVDGGFSTLSGMMTWADAAARMQPPLPVYQDLEAASDAQAAYLDEAWGPDLVDFVQAGLVEAPGGGLTVKLTAPVRLLILRDLFDLDPLPLVSDVAGPLVLAVAGVTWPGPEGERFADWKRRSVETIQEARPEVLARWFESRHDIPLYQPGALAQDLDRLATASALEQVARVAAGLQADWSRPAHGDEAGWDAKDLLAHLASTQVAIAGIAAAPPAAAAEMAERPAFEPDRWNSSQVRRRRETPVADLVTELRQGADRTWAALPAADLAAITGIGRYAGRPLGLALAAMGAHQLGHLAELEQALAG
ncbi:MAG: alpha/beta hydrolase [Candidatus Dormibacteraeota bacterium]|nr:alpha/beta hydrolase [Candidatus Dormibacteraeota bacterium]